MYVRIAMTILTAALVLTGCSGNGDDAAEDTGDDTAADSGGASESVTIGAEDIYYTNDGQRSDQDDVTFTAAAGTVEMTLENDGALEHNVLVEEEGDTLVVSSDAGATETGTIDLESGDYTIYCDIAGHREAGMEASLTVE